MNPPAVLDPPIQIPHSALRTPHCWVVRVGRVDIHFPDDDAYAAYGCGALAACDVFPVTTFDTPEEALAMALHRQLDPDTVTTPMQ